MQRTIDLYPIVVLKRLASLYHFTKHANTSDVQI